MLSFKTSEKDKTKRNPNNEPPKSVPTKNCTRSTSGAFVLLNTAAVCGAVNILVFHDYGLIYPECGGCVSVRMCGRSRPHQYAYGELAMRCVLVHRISARWGNVNSSVVLCARDMDLRALRGRSVVFWE